MTAPELASAPLTMPELASAILDVAPADAESVSVVQRLIASRQAHTAYRSALPRMTPQGPTAGDADVARAALETAARQRAQAELADPNHLEAGWNLDPHPDAHAELLAFYQDQITR